MNAPHFRFIKWTLLIMIFFSGFVAPVSAREVPWSELYQQAVSLYQKGKHPQALNAAQTAWKMAQSSFTPGDSRNADSLVILASIERVLGMYLSAENDFQGALIIREKIFGINNLNCVECLTNLAEMELDQENFEKAALYGERALDVVKKNLEEKYPEHPVIAEVSVLVAEIYLGLWRLEEAGQICEPALGTLEKVYGKKHSAYAWAQIVTAQINYGLNPKNKVDISDAREILSKYNKGKNTWLGSAWFFEGRVNQAKGDYKRAISCYKKAQEVWGKALSSNHPLVGKAIVGLGEVYQLQAKYPKALSLYENAQRIWEGAFGLAHPFLAMVLFLEAETQYSEGKESLAGLTFHRSLVLQEKISGSENPGTVKCLIRIAEIYQIYGQYSEAEPLCDQTLDVIIPLAPPNASIVGITRSLRGRIYMNQGRLEEAETEIKAALEILQANTPNDKLELTKCLLNQARLLVLTGKYEEALSLFKKEFDTLEKALGANHLYLAMILEDRAELSERLGKVEEAQKLRKRAEVIRAKKQAKFIFNFS
ncbi:MAG TPA: tetratricopeptide repeat protein [Bacillota bacterium]|nr:tetratricopeptide repeat protein [Bacillota bacterium]